jgi:hypothetical protein
MSCCTCRAALIELLFVWIGCVVQKLWNGLFWLENSLWGSFCNNSQKANFGSVVPTANSFREAASFELQMTKIGQAFLKLFDSTFKLEIPILALKWGFSGNNSPNKIFLCWNPKRHILGPNRIDWYIMREGRAPGVGCARARESNIIKKK